MALQIPAKLTESELWRTSRDIVHFVGICGAGKSTMCADLARRIEGHGGKVIGTIDYDPHTPDHEAAAEHAFSRELDQRNIAASCLDPAVHEAIVRHTLATLTRWVESDANVVLVDRWYESYDLLPPEHVSYIEAAIRSSGFRVHHVLLVVANSIFGNDLEPIRARLLHTKGTRPASWWNSGPASLDAWAREEQACQDAYRVFVHRSPFGSLEINTLGMDWPEYEDEIVSSLIQRRWFDAFEGSWNDRSRRPEHALPSNGRLWNTGRWMTAPKGVE